MPKRMNPARVLLVICAPVLAAQSFDFEKTLSGFVPDGLAFANQPVSAVMIKTDRIAPVTLGGDYWASLSYPMGQNGQYLIATGWNYGDGVTGTLLSPAYALPASPLYFSLRIGGTNDPIGERVELQLRMSSAEQAVFADRTGPLTRDGDFVVIKSFTGAGYEQLRQESFHIPDFLLPRDARMKVIDASSSGHINLDYLQFTATPPTPVKTPVWGFADYHTHPMNYLAFGGLKGQRIIWGSPGGNYEDYKQHPELVFDDLLTGVKGHGGGPFANPFLNAAQKFAFTPSPTLLVPHGESGAPDFKDWPAFNAGTHEQMHITQIRRSYEGGLRLMVGLATDNLGAEFLVSPLENGKVRLVEEFDSLNAQIRGMVEQARLNSSWMQIAYSPEDARDIILHNKLAVIMGLEVDKLGDYGDMFPTIADELDYFWNLGVRVVTPIHAIDNKLGGPMVFFDIYNWDNDLFHRGKLDMTLKELTPQNVGFFQAVDDDQCTDPAPGTCIQYRPDPKQKRLYVGFCTIVAANSPCLTDFTDPYFARDKIKHGVKNQLGLRPFGHDYIRALMDRGFILDTAHMSDASVAATYGVIGEKLAADHPECTGFTFDSDPKGDCDKWAYPASISHAHFRAQAFPDTAKTPDKPATHDAFPPAEYDISNRNIEMVRRTGGVLGAFIAESRMSQSGLPFLADCSLSSEFFGYSFHFAHTKLNYSGVGIATDFTLIPGVSPRFGKNACWGYHTAENPDNEKAAHPERYKTSAQIKGVVYEGMPPKKGVKTGVNAPLKADRLGNRTFDVNVDGLAHFGMVPDVFQDLKNLGLPPADFEALFSSAEGYIQMWEKSLQLCVSCTGAKSVSPNSRR
jgi:microsomal dipeptidase-like Zn-dependent dipeptidase